MQLTTGWHTTVYFHSLVTIRQIWSEPLACTFHVSKAMGTMQKNLVINCIECWALGSSITHELLSRALSTSAWPLINTVSALWYCLWADWWILFKLLSLFLMAWLNRYRRAAGGLFNTFRDNISIEMGQKLLKSWLRFAFLWQGDKEAFFRLFVTDVLSWRHSFWTVAGIESRSHYLQANLVTSSIRVKIDFLYNIWSNPVIF